jgi:hypothetical protein
MGRVRRGALVTLAIAGTASMASTQEFEPRTYSATPVGLNFLGLGYGFSTGNVLLDPSLPIEGLDADLHTALFRYTRTLSFFDRTAKLKVVLPWSAGDWRGLVEGEPGQRSANGLGDARFALETIVAGARAMTAEELAKSQPGTLLGARLQVVMPTGSYDPSELVNLGSNRWAFVPEMGISHNVGAWTLEAAWNAWLFTDNADFLEGHRLDQDPLFVAKFHAIYTIRSGFWWALAAGFGYGGQTKVDGAPRATLQRNTRFSAMLVYPVSASTGVSVAITSGKNSGAGADFDGIAVGYQVAWTDR